MIKALKRFTQTFIRERSGATAALVTFLIPLAIGMFALVVDLNNARNVRNAMQTSADAAALAGSLDIGSDTGDPLATATSYSATAGNKNAIPGVTVTMVTGYPQLACITPATTYGPCFVSKASPGSPNANIIYVKETASVPTVFSKYFGINSIPVTVASSAVGHGGKARKMDVMIILDTTQSMTSTDASCSATRIACAEAGAQLLLQTLAPSIHSVGLMVFPGVTNATNAGYDYDCSSSAPAIAAYNASPLYTIVGLSTDYKTSDTATTLNTSSNIVRALGGGGTGCTNGLSVVGGQGTFYAAAVTAAQSYLVTNGRAGAQKVIIMLGDGDAQSNTAPNTVNECGQAVTTAGTAKTAGTWVYTIGYGAKITGTCSKDTSPTTSACATLLAMATDSSHFFYDSTSTCTGGQSVTSLQQAFQKIATTLLAPMIVPYS